MAEYTALGGLLRAPAWPLLAALACTPAPPAAPAPLVLLISVDTTRADDLSCYGGPHASTPSLDGLAARGVRFSLALSPAPTTLSAHASLFTGLDAHGTAVLRNGDTLRTDVPVLAERFAAAGWDTIGVAGASAIDRNTGINRGFRLYDDAMDAAVRKRFESSGPDVTARALAALDQRAPGEPLFLFVHYYDAHMPWTSAPASFQARFLNPTYTGHLHPNAASVARVVQQARREGLDAADADQARRYHLAEVAWADQAIGALLSGLEARGLLADSLIVATADHGESLGEPGALEVLATASTWIRARCTCRSSWPAKGASPCPPPWWIARFASSTWPPPCWASPGSAAGSALARISRRCGEGSARRRPWPSPRPTRPGPTRSPRAGTT